MYFHLTIVIIFFILIYVYQKNNTYYTYQNILNKTETKRMNKMIQVIIERGLISPSCHWWKISDSLKDKSGILIYNTMMSRSTKPFIGIEVLQTKVFLVTQPYYINEILQNSPHLFAVGKLKETLWPALWNDLTEYCKQDTYAMVLLLDVLKKVSVESI